MTASHSDSTGSSLARGYYTAAEAARLLRVPTNKVTRWAAGYEFKGRSGRFQESPPVIHRELRSRTGEVELTFLDVIELLFVKKFRDEGVSLPMIRAAATAAAELLGTDKPFCVKKLKTDGRHIFAQLHERLPNAPESSADRRLLLDLAYRQHVFTEIVSPFLKDFDYDVETELVRRWWPIGKDRGVYVDPSVNFGAPVIERFGVPTAVVFEQVKKGRKLEEVAAWYEIPVESARNALAFERPTGA